MNVNPFERKKSALFSIIALQSSGENVNVLCFKGDLSDV